MFVYCRMRNFRYRPRKVTVVNCRGGLRMKRMPQHLVKPTQSIFFSCFLTAASVLTIVFPLRAVWSTSPGAVTARESSPQVTPFECACRPARFRFAAAPNSQHNITVVSQCNAVRRQREEVVFWGKGSCCVVSSIFGVEVTYSELNWFRSGTYAYFLPNVQTVCC